MYGKMQYPVMIDDAYRPDNLFVIACVMCVGGPVSGKQKRITINMPDKIQCPCTFVFA